MSNALAIAAVTAVLKDLLNDGLINQNLDDAFDFQVTAQPPDRLAGMDNGQPQDRLNLFLYRVSHNTGLSNLRYPSRTAAGERCSNPYLALDLHYMLSATGSDDLNAEILLGYGMQVLHEIPVLDRDAIRTSLGLPSPPVEGAILPPAFQQLAAADLADQIEQVKISPYHLDLEEISQLWTAVSSPLRMTALYLISVVLIESEAPARQALPVRTRGLYVQQLRRPTIERILSREDPGDPPALNRIIHHGDQLLLQGFGLRGDITRVRVGTEELEAGELADRRIMVEIPGLLHPGVTGVQVVHSIEKVPPGVGELPGELSNLAAFVLSPSFAEVDPIQLTAAELEDGGVLDGPVEGTIRILFDHPVGARQSADLILNEFDPPEDRRSFAYSFGATLPPPNVEEVTQLDFDFENVEQALYRVRVRVDGADTELRMEPGDPQIQIEPLP